MRNSGEAKNSDKEIAGGFRASVVGSKKSFDRLSQFLLGAL
jgi:hypothetical protein